MKKNKKEKHTSDKVVAAAITAITLFWISEIFLLILGHEGFPDKFIICWFTFWSVELASLAGIKITKVRKSPYISNEEEAGG